VLDEARQTDKNFDVVAVHSTRSNSPRQALGAQSDKRSRWTFTPRGADADRLVGPEPSMRKGDDVALLGLLDSGRSGACGTDLHAGLDADDNSRGTRGPPAAFSFEAVEFFSQCCQRPEGVFFLPNP
jgi:hypothetical protein